tara:strand:- start:778 stop:1656 length:879 start_codon:yes stop_codon:yes gene_type:complete
MDKTFQEKIMEINNLDLSIEEKNRKIQELYNTKTNNTKINNKIQETEINENNTNTKKECKHYTNNCELYCEICEDFFSCRLCHNEIITSHEFDRYNVKKIKCKICNVIQDVSNKCVNCEIQFGVYYCNICNLYENINTEIYHCNECNICRKGKKKEYRHCKNCNGCIGISNFDNHKCINNSVNSNCPICMDSIFYSTEQITSLKCGHYIHLDCLINYSKNNYKCPLCLVSICDMSEQWKQIDNYLLLNPIPEEFKKKVNIVCYDCKVHSTSDFHFDYIKCLKCNSYNTTIKQ